MVSSTDKNVATSFFDITITYDSYALRVKQGLGDIVRAVPILMLVGKHLRSPCYGELSALLFFRFISWAYPSDLYGVRMTLSPRCIVSFTDRTERTPAREACTRVMLA